MPILSLADVIILASAKGIRLIVKTARKLNDLYLRILVIINCIPNTKYQIALVSPSTWLGQCASQSTVFKNCTITTIPNTIDTNTYTPINVNTARQLLNLPEKTKILLFGAASATSDPRKGYDLLKSALTQLSQNINISNIMLVVFGASHGNEDCNSPFQIRYMGKLHDELTLRLLYSAADVFICPSREDNLPNTIIEASACATASVGFDTCGIPDLIEHGVTGALAKPFDTKSLASAIENALIHSTEYGKNARKKAEQTYNETKISKHYLKLYRKRLEIKK